MLGKEYFFSGDKEKILDHKTVLFIFVASVALCLGISLYLHEQAKQNLTVHIEIMKENKELQTDKETIQSNLNKTRVVLMECMANQTESGILTKGK